MQGLGKTVESIALMLHRPRPEEDAAFTASTLIVTPPSILKQWVKEVCICCWQAQRARLVKVAWKLQA